MKPVQSKEEWLNEQSKEQLIIFYKNNEYEIQRLRDKITLLTGCAEFGDCDGTDGGCIDCYYDNLHLHQRCHLFQPAFHQYRKEREKIMDKSIYVITTFERWPTDEQRWDYGCSRSSGFYCTFEDAEDSVINNVCNIWESCYNYAQITKLEPGLYGYAGDNWYYKYNRKSGKYEKMENVEYPLFHICGLG